MSDLTPPQKRPRRSSDDRLAARLAILQRSKEHITALQTCFSEYVNDADVFPFEKADTDIRVLVSALKGLTEITKRSPQQRRKDHNFLEQVCEFVASLPEDPPDGTQPMEVPEDFGNEAQASASDKDIKPEKASSHWNESRRNEARWNEAHWNASYGLAAMLVTVDEMDSQLCEPTVSDMDSQSQM